MDTLLLEMIIFKAILQLIILCFDEGLVVSLVANNVCPTIFFNALFTFSQVIVVCIE